VSYVCPPLATVGDRRMAMMNLALTDEAFLCEDSKGNGCGRMFDGLIVDRVRGLCRECAADLPEDEEC
jgi:hypothetical protein